FQAEDGIRDFHVTGVQTCALPIWETLGVNSKRQLAELERIHQRNIADGLLDAGVTLADPGRIEVRGRLTCGIDVSIDVNCVFEGDRKASGRARDVEPGGTMSLHQ